MEIKLSFHKQKKPFMLEYKMQIISLKRETIPEMPTGKFKIHSSHLKFKEKRRSKTRNA